MSTPIGLPGPTGGDDRDVNHPTSEDASGGDGCKEDGDCHRSEGTSGTSQPGQRESRDRRRARRRRPADHYIPQRNAILTFMGTLPQLVLIGMVTPAKANAINATLRTLLDHLPKDREPAAPGGSIPASQIELLRANPALLEALMPLLSPEQLYELADDEEVGDGT